MGVTNTSTVNSQKDLRHQRLVLWTSKFQKKNPGKIGPSKIGGDYSHVTSNGSTSYSATTGNAMPLKFYTVFDDVYVTVCGDLLDRRLSMS